MPFGERWSRWQILACCAFLVAGVGVIDSASVAESLTTLGYLVPIAFGTFWLGRGTGLALALLCFFVSAAADRGNLGLNNLGELGVFVAFALLVARLRTALLEERATSADSLRRSGERFQNLAEESPSMILIVAEDRVLYANKLCEATLGYARETMMAPGFSFLGLVAKGDAPGVAATLREANEDRKDHSIEYDLLARDQRPVRVMHAMKCIDYEGRLALLGTITDITERRRREVEVNRLSQAAAQAPDSIEITDETGALVYVNPAFERTMGYTGSEVLGKNPRILKSGRQDRAFYDDMWQVLTRGEVWRGHIVNRCKDGSLVEQEATIAPVRDSSGKIVNYVAVKRDVTKELELQRQITQLQKMEGIGRLAAGVAHDFNNLLGVISGYGELAQRGLDPAGAPFAKLTQVLKASERAADLTRQLLAFSRQQNLQPKVLDLSAVVFDAEKMVRRIVGEDVEVATALPQKLGRIKADPGQIHQIVLNLAANARDAMLEGGRLLLETADVELDGPYARVHPPCKPGSYVNLIVTDNGCGMPPEVKSRIFEPFFTTKALGSGTGLGLATVYGIVKQSGGYIWVYSEVGHGTTFKIYFPRVDEDLPTDVAKSPREAVRGSGTILLVEDERMLRELLTETLTASGYTVLAAEEGGAACRIAKTHVGPIDLLITDVIMPAATGKKVAEEITLARPSTKILYISGYTGEAIGRAGVLEAGAPLLAKPFSAHALTQRVREILTHDG
jgi:two-component system cell cycle sensor histidine kinase/response regulator CckA